MPRERIVKLIRLAAPPEWAGKALSVAVVNDSRMRKLNASFARTDAATDVLAFPLEEGRGGQSGAPWGEEDAVGEIVVSGESARREAAAREVEPEAELALYVAHGVLHLLGYDDQTDADRKRMYRKESQLLRKVGLQSPRGAASRK